MPVIIFSTISLRSLNRLSSRFRLCLSSPCSKSSNTWPVTLVIMGRRDSLLAGSKSGDRFYKLKLVATVTTPLRRQVGQHKAAGAKKVEDCFGASNFKRVSTDPIYQIVP